MDEEALAPEEPAEYAPPLVPSVLERPPSEVSVPLPDEEAAYSLPETPSTTLLSIPEQVSATDQVSPVDEVSARDEVYAPVPPVVPGAPCVYPDETSLYSTPEVPSATVLGALPDEPSEYPTPATPSRTIVRDGVLVTVEPEEESEFPTPLAPSDTVLYDARRDPCFVETFVDFMAKEDIDMRAAVWDEEQARRAPEVTEEYQGWLDVKLDRTCRGVAASVPDEHAPEDMFFDFDDTEEKCAREAAWREQQKEVDKEVITPSFFGWREWMEMEEMPAPTEIKPSEPEVFADFPTEQEIKFREGVWSREQMEPCPESVLETLGRPLSPRRVPVDTEQAREISHDETFSDFPNEQERRWRESIWEEEQSKVLETVFGEKIRCGEKPPDIYRLDTFHDFPDNKERYERDEIWQKEQGQVFQPKDERIFEGWEKVVQPEFSDYEDMTEEQVYTRERLWRKEQTKQLEDVSEAPFEGWEAGRDRSVEEMFEDFPDNQEKTEREAVWDEEQKKMYREKGEGFEGWLEKEEEEEEQREPGVVVSFVETFRDIDDARERCACNEVWQEEQYKRAPEFGEKFDGWNEYDPCTRVEEGQQVVEVYEEQPPYVPETFEDFPETEEKEEREAMWMEEQKRTASPEKEASVFDGWESKAKAVEEEEERMFWDFPDKEESCRRQKIWHDEQAKVRPDVEFDECGNRIPVFHGWGPQRVPCERKEFVSPPPPQPVDELAADYEVESILAEEREHEAFMWNEYQLEQSPGTLSYLTGIYLIMH